MTFLNPLYLIALAAASIPIILHLLNLRKARVVEFSSLVFLKEMQKSNIRKLKIRQWILLALRTLIIIFIVLAFTRPALRTSFSFLPGASARSSVVILFDDSFSMLSQDDGGQLLKQGKTRALQILNLLKPGDEAVFLPLSSVRAGRKRFSSVLEAIRQDIDALQAGYVHGSMVDGITAAAALFEESGNINRELYIITDGQKSHFAMEGISSPSPVINPGVQTYLVRLGEKSPDNAAITDVKVINTVFQINRPVTITASVTNFSSTPLRNSLVSVFLEGTRVMQKAVDVEPNETETVEFLVQPKSEGFLRGFIELEDDLLPADNLRYFALYVPKNLRVLLGPSGSQSATFVRLALQPVESANTFSVEVMDRGALVSAAFDKFDAVILTGTEQLGPSTLKRLAGYVAQGGGVLLFPSPDGQGTDLNRDLLPSLGLPQEGGLSGSIGGTGGFSTFASVDFDHPLFQGVFETPPSGKKPEIESPHVRAALRLRGGDSSLTIIALSNGDPFLMEHRHGKGRVLLMASAPELGWSDFPMKGLFLPLMHRSVFYLASREEYVMHQSAGLPFELVLPAGLPMGSTLTLQSDDGRDQRLPVRPVATGFAVSSEGLDRPGVFTAFTGSTPLRALVVNGDPRESDPTRLEASESRAFFQRMGMTRVAALSRNDDIVVTVNQGRYGVELWKYCIAAALLCALVEMLIARGTRRKKMTA